MNQEDKEQKQNYQATLEGKRPSSQVSVLLENHIKPFLLSLALSSISEKDVFTIRAEI